MEQQQLKRCSIGVQTFEKVIEGNYLYIDKTEYITVWHTVLPIIIS